MAKAKAKQAAPKKAAAKKATAAKAPAKKAGGRRRTPATDGGLQKIEAEQDQRAAQATKDGIVVVVDDVFIEVPAPGSSRTLRKLKFHAGQIVNQGQLDAAADQGTGKVKTRAVTGDDLPALI